MDLMEYQGKELFRKLGIPTTARGEIATTPAAAETHAANFGVPVMVKAQVLTGGRGKAGGVKFCNDPDEARARASEILGLDISGHTVEKVLVEPASDLAEEYYLSILHDRTSKGYKVIASVEGGVEIEQVADQSLEAGRLGDEQCGVGGDRRGVGRGRGEVERRCERLHSTA